MSEFTVGIDLGSFKTSIVASNGQRAVVESIVGQPKDGVASRVLARKVAKRAFGGRVLFGKDVHGERLALNVIRPFEQAILKYRSADQAGLTEDDVSERRRAISLLLQHVVSSVGASADEPVRAVIGAPSCASLEARRVIVEAGEDVFDSVVVVPEPFAVAYGVDSLSSTLVIDMGAGTVDICPMNNAFPQEEEQVTIAIAGDLIDVRFTELMAELVPDAEISMKMAREIKERYGCVFNADGEVTVKLPSKSGNQKFYDISEPLKQACDIVVDPIVQGIKDVIARVDPEFRQGMLDNILLSGGGSQLAGLDRRIEFELRDHHARVNRVYDYVFAGAIGAHRIAMELEPEEWTMLGRLDDGQPAEEPVAIEADVEADAEVEIVNEVSDIADDTAQAA
jgi:rod shape-determining protein MreB